ncbi:carbon-nitrogen family hydrolase [Mangrovibacillus cuniculi]|uniref:Carbon-nitrogen family hydrolase n=1 Tax=Mangrovibacillus cuniculi TaxID=2593652 RepID=A0A7S8C9Y8_9BACI|nr:carbon-nitrogen family hydrolase [Mangrovibacillus cuniculi]QPC46134.1 carbon-nitrogen family hydrolase [Mangrovibacillus cuniculi]
MKIALIQADLTFGEPKINKENIELKLQSLDKDTEIVVLPELWTTAYDLTRLDEIADEHAKWYYEVLQEWATTYTITLVGGSTVKKVNDVYTNHLAVASPTDGIIHTYDKAHLFRLMDEHLYLKDGHKESLFTINQTKAATLICYDIRFPEWSRKAVRNGAEILFIVAEWPLKRLDHWRTLLIARAIENQCFVVACNRAGSDPQNVFAGHSLIIDPWGTIVSEGTEKEEIIYGTIDSKQVQEVRSMIPIFEDRREDIY